VVDGIRSEEHELDCNVPQGSVLGPSMFGDYSSPVQDIFNKHGVNFHLYADDSQIYLSFPVGDESVAMEQITRCVEVIRMWLAQNFLKFNEEKTDFITLGCKSSLEKIKELPITVGDATIQPASHVKNIGGTFDKLMKVDKQVSIVCRSAWHSLHQLGKIKQYLTITQLHSVIIAFVISKLDQNNSLLVGSPRNVTKKLQSVQNAAARLLLGVNKYCEPPLQKLHWLPVIQRIDFKVLLLCYKSLHHNGPAYLKELLVPYHPTRTLRSASDNLLHQPNANMASYGDRAFSVVAPRLWNQLSNHIKCC